jgi:D-alanyl-D-alanine carboxypeptidase/D-alanyl-D-alanine-endopeptidase (penicillin-binding protein 4)
VTGQIIGDASRYDGQSYSDALPPDLLAQNQVGPISALSVNDGFTSWPPQQGPNAPNPVPTPNPPAYAAQVLANLLRARGVTVGGTGAGKAPASAQAIAQIESPAMPQLLHQLVSGSDNETAEAFVKEMAVHEGRPGTFANGLDVVRKEIRSLGLPTAGLTLADGSGLSSDNKVTCTVLAGVLNKSGPSGLLGQSLSVAGRDGTLADRFTNPTVKGKLRAKTGSLNFVSALSGFADTASGTDLTFVYVANGRTYSNALLAIQDILAAGLVKYPDGVPVALLGPRGSH